MASTTTDGNASDNIKTVQGSCHCSKINYTMSLNLKPPLTTTRCNCRICLKTGFTGIWPIKDSFKLISPSSVSDLPDYQSKEGVHRYYCDQCGVHVYAEGVYDFGGNKVEFFVVNLVTVEQPQEGIELSEFKIKYISGRNDDFGSGMSDEPIKGMLP